MKKEPQRVHRVRTEDLQIGATIERSEHPWASERTARHLARDHLQQNPNAYKTGHSENVNLTLNQNIKVRTPQKRKPVPKQPPSNSPEWIPPVMRLWG